MAALVEYDPRAVVMTWGPTLLTRGIPQGNFVTIERNSVTWELRRGGDGEVARVRTNDFSGRISFTLRRGSQTNTALAAQLQVDEITGLIILPFLLKDLSGVTLWASPIAFLEGFPIDSYGGDEGTREWTLLCDPLIPFPGGSLPP